MGSIKRPGILILLIGGVLGLCLCVMVAVVFFGDVDEPQVAVAQNTAVPEPTESVPTLAPNDKLLSDLLDKLGKNNRDIVRISEFLVGSEITIVWSLNDNLSDDFIRRGAMLDIVNMLEVIEASSVPYDSVFFSGTFLLADEFGNNSESIVVRVWYSRETINKINFANFLTDNIYNIADVYWLHPVMK